MYLIFLSEESTAVIVFITMVLLALLKNLCLPPKFANIHHSNTLIRRREDLTTASLKGTIFSPTVP